MKITRNCHKTIPCQSETVMATSTMALKAHFLGQQDGVNTEEIELLTVHTIKRV